MLHCCAYLDSQHEKEIKNWFLTGRSEGFQVIHGFRENHRKMSIQDKIQSQYLPINGKKEHTRIRDHARKPGNEAADQELVRL
jgi:hypothetical protein